MFNIKSKAAAETYTLDLLDVDDTPLLGEGGKQCQVVLYGPGTKQFQKAKSAQENRLMARLKKKGNVDQTPDEKLKQQAEFLADVTKEFVHFDYEGMPPGREMAIATYSDPEIGFVAEQANKAAHDWANFSKPSPTA